MIGQHFVLLKHPIVQALSWYLRSPQCSQFSCMELTWIDFQTVVERDLYVLGVWGHATICCDYYLKAITVPPLHSYY